MEETNFSAKTCSVRLGTEHLWARNTRSTNLGGRKWPTYLPPGATLCNVARRGTERGFAHPCNQLRRT